jgi:hypothetical protein
MTGLNWARFCAGMLLASAFMLATGCQMGVEHGEVLEQRDDELDFNGFTQVSGGQVRIEAFNKATQAWQPVGRVRATTTAVTVKGYQGQPLKLYYWTKKLRLSDLPDFRCFVEADCTLDPPEQLVQFRFAQPDVGIPYAQNYGPGASACTAHKVDQGVDVVTAYQACDTIDPDGEHTADITYVVKPAGADELDW